MFVAGSFRPQENPSVDLILLVDLICPPLNRHSTSTLCIVYQLRKYSVVHCTRMCTGRPRWSSYATGSQTCPLSIINMIDRDEFRYQKLQVSQASRVGRNT